MTSDPLVAAALETARRLAAAAEPDRDGLTWHAEIVVGVDGDKPVIGHGNVGETLYDGTAGIALGLAAAALAASPPEAAILAEAARGAACHALSGAPEMLDADRLGLFDGATGVALSAVIAGRALADTTLLARGADLTRQITARVEARIANPPDGAELDLIGGLAGILLGLQGITSTTGDAQPVALLRAGADRLAAAAELQTWGAAWSTGASAGGPPLLGLGHGAAGIALALAEIGALCDDELARRACADGLEYERGWYDPDRVAWPDLRTYTGDEPASWMAAWCHGAIGIGLSRLRLASLTSEPLALAESSAALQSGRNLVVSAGTALRTGQTSDCTACHGLAGVVELLLVAAKALGVAAHAAAARRAAGLLIEQQNAAAGVWPCGLPGAGEIPGLMTGTSGIVLTLLRAAAAVDLPTPLLPGPAHW